MAFLFQDQNQGIRNDVSPRANARRPPQTVLFHPDYNRRLRNRTESADPSSPKREKKALAGLGYVTLTAGGDFHPALRTSAALNGRPDINMTKGRRLSKRHPQRNLHVPMPMEQGSGGFAGSRFTSPACGGGRITSQ